MVLKLNCSGHARIAITERVADIRSVQGRKRSQSQRGARNGVTLG
jgi:hypothetical protein